jgi:hypothetical protein
VLLARYRKPVADLEAEMLSGLSATQAKQLRKAIIARRDALDGSSHDSRTAAMR